MVKAVLFDADGVLVDACELHYVAFNRALSTTGWSVSRQEHLTIYNGLPTHKKLMLLTETKGFPRDWHDAVYNLKQDLTRQAIDECLEYAPEKRELLEKIRSSGIRVAVCSNSLHSTLDRMLKAVGIYDLLDVVLGNDDVGAPKPAPEMYLLAAKRLGVSISECLIVEDSPIGLQAAYAACPLQVIQVDGPREVDLSLLSRIRRQRRVVREAA